MKKLLKSKPIYFLYFMLTNFALQAQQLDLETPVKGIVDQIKAIFPYIAGAIFLVVVMVNLGHFVKEGGDWKKGVTSIIIFVVIIGIIAGLFQYITSIQL